MGDQSRRMYATGAQSDIKRRAAFRFYEYTPWESPLAAAESKKLHYKQPSFGGCEIIGRQSPSDGCGGSFNFSRNPHTSFAAASAVRREVV